ncbi:MAG: hypothetical protein KC464_11235 [Myxococcales bacterium]|nr:hypothetical protein [Myxococcales bacterium]MCB9508272.1 hypothetical protein [Myxococcales bacterium]
MAETTQPVTAPATCRSGILGWLWSLFGSSTPAYVGAGQPAQGRSWCGWLSTTPVYQPAPAEQPADEPKVDDAASQGTVNIVIRRE